jgi:hypothetical protein
MIEEYIKIRSNSDAASVNQIIIKKDTKIMLGESSEYCTKMIEAVKEYRKKQKTIKKHI